MQDKRVNEQIKYIIYLYKYIRYMQQYKKTLKYN